MDLILATRNRGKAAEFRHMLDAASAGRLRMRSLAEASIDVGDFEPDETGRTFRANACLKASQYAQRLGAWALADDSGLAVDALGGRPGVHSARFAEIESAGQGDADNNTHLLRLMQSVPDRQRTARFICVLALADPRGRIVFTAEGAVEGVLARDPRGGGGFGYDPLFVVPSLGRTTAELSPDEKHAISHRGQALRRLRSMLERHRLERDS